MTTVNDSRQFMLVLSSNDSDLAEARELALWLRNELRNGDVLSADFVASTLAAPSGAKSPTTITSDPILLTLAVTAIPSVILLIQQWLLRQQNQTLRAKIGEAELEVPRNASPAEIDRIVHAVRRLPQLTKQK